MKSWCEVLHSGALSAAHDSLRSEGKVKRDVKGLGFWVELWGKVSVTMAMPSATFLPSDCRGGRFWVAFVEVHRNTYTPTDGLPQSTHPSIPLPNANPHAGSTNLLLREHFLCQLANHALIALPLCSGHLRKNKSASPAWWALYVSGLPQNIDIFPRI